MFLCRNLPTAAMFDTLLRLKVLFPWQMPYLKQYFQVYEPFLHPALRGHSKYFCDLLGFLLNSRRKYIRQFFYRTQPHLAHHRLFPCHPVTIVFQGWLPVWFEFYSILSPYGEFYFSQSVILILQVVLRAALMKVPFYYWFYCP